MNELIFALLVWLQANTNFQVPSVPPQVQFVDKADLYRLTGDEENGLIIPEAAFNGKSMTMYLINGFDVTDKMSQSYVLHELVHYVQFSNLKPYRCVAQLEPEAYILQTKWLEQQGIESPFKWLPGLFMGCPGDFRQEEGDL